MTSDRPHVTTERQLDAPLLTFEIFTLLAQLRTEPSWQRGHDAMTLAKSRGLRVVLVAMHPKSVLLSHVTDSPLSLQVIDGELKLSTDSQTVTLRTGQLLVLQGGVRHTVEASAESAFLLTLSTEAKHPAEG